MLKFLISIKKKTTQTKKLHIRKHNHALLLVYKIIKSDTNRHRDVTTFNKFLKFSQTSFKSFTQLFSWLATFLVVDQKMIYL